MLNRYPGATDTEISALETRLKSTLPPSYRNFLTASNGWCKLDNMIDRLLSTQEVDWLASKDQEGINAWMSGVEMGGG
ncbi:SMI1/KNR4 family protein [Brasilonema sp. UFV-L1]|uniref:SMI1/KNR4 family protein n=1 Tax=Brasilonema sp. UFV-L1 TaxID=2234130 RepID=UPI00168FE163|nr:SMI1/KNR4 family protein [Brasilonema sp. UFV-L1]NMG10908.1 hypothetical protein [Brasilonema sp. UFV-L1]